jgi:hypothetical protein
MTGTQTFRRTKISSSCARFEFFFTRDFFKKSRKKISIEQLVCQVLEEEYGDVLEMGNGGTMCHNNNNNNININNNNKSESNFKPGKRTGDSCEPESPGARPCSRGVRRGA